MAGGDGPRRGATAAFGAAASVTAIFCFFANLPRFAVVPASSDEEDEEELELEGDSSLSEDEASESELSSLVCSTVAAATTEGGSTALALPLSFVGCDFISRSASRVVQDRDEVSVRRRRSLSWKIHRCRCY